MFSKCFLFCAIMMMITMSLSAKKSEEVEETSEENVGQNHNSEGKRGDFCKMIYYSVVILDIGSFRRIKHGFKCPFKLRPNRTCLIPH